MRRWQFLFLVSVLAVSSLTAGLIVASQRGSTETSANRSPGGAIVLRGNGIGGSVFGQPQATAIGDLQAALEPPNPTHLVDMSGNCTVDSAMEWRSMTVYFFHGAFVGYATGSLLGGPGHNDVPDVVTSTGLRIGDPLSRAVELYGGELRTSFAQGGSWSVSTSSGQLDGYLTSEVDSTAPVPRIADITAGSVGCPAASP